MLPDKAQGAYSVQLAWAAPHGDLWVDICENAAFAPGTFANKHAGAVSFTDAPNGFSNGLTLQPGKTYFWRVWDGAQHFSGPEWRVPGTAPPSPATVPNNWESCGKAALAHWSKEDAITMLAIAAAESGSFTALHGDSVELVHGNPALACNNMLSHGAWQVYMGVHSDKLIKLTGSLAPCDWAKYLEDPNKCAEVAWMVWHERGGGLNGLKAWSTFNVGAHLQHMARATEVINGLQP